MDLRQGVDTWWTAITTGFGRGDGLELGPVQLLIILGVLTIELGSQRAARQRQAAS